MFKKEKISFLDFIGKIFTVLSLKDSQIGYSYAYTWLANQFSHSALGFALVISISWIFQKQIQLAPSGIYVFCLIGPMLFWLFYELIITIRTYYK